MNKRNGHKRSGHGRKRTAKKAPKDKKVYRKGSKSKTMKGKKDFTTKKTSKVFNRRKRYQKHAKGSRVIRRPYHKKGGSAPYPSNHKSHPHSKHDSKTTPTASHTAASQKHAKVGEMLHLAQYMEMNTNDPNQMILDKKGAELLAKELGDKSASQVGEIDLTTLGKGGLAKDFDLSSKTVKATGFAKTAFDDLVRLAEDGPHDGSFRYTPGPDNTGSGDLAKNQSGYHIGTQDYIDYVLGLLNAPPKLGSEEGSRRYRESNWSYKHADKTGR